MNDCIVSVQAIANHAENAARNWALNPQGPAPACPWPEGSAAHERWRATLQRYLVLYGATLGECEEQSA